MVETIDSDLKSMLCDLESALSEQDAYDEEFLRPTDTAFKRSYDLLLNSGRALTEKYPLGSVFPDGDGGIRIEWRISKRHVRLIIPASSNLVHYVYYQDGVQYSGEDDISALRLAYYLNWLTNETIPCAGLQSNRLPSHS